jgi:PTS system nitrogen regulatory IIA component
MSKLNVTIEQCDAGVSLPDASSVIDDIARRIAEALHLPSRTSVQKALEKRERLGSTGLEQGIAIPHCSLQGVERFVAGIITLQRPVDFGAIDGKGSDIFVFVAGPEEQRTEHVRILAALTSQLRSEETRSRIRNASDGKELVRIIGAGLDTGEAEETGPFSLIVIYIQDEDRYEPILETVSGEADSSVAVTEMKSAGSVLNRMPLFATFWNDQETRAIHRIEVVLPRDRVNRTIRSIEEIGGRERGVQVSVLDL